MKNTVKLAFAALVFTFAVVACQPKKTEEATAPADSTVVETPVDSAATTPADSTATPADSTAHH
ncbi:MAG TPA: hypothetical protein VIN08_14780 [Ohtaekwangia sp.]|uniref:hypothetical protein n=1 Tax=Ohtaekwangia sp. TaxID=2066019 RepID=UPI002F95989F